MVKFASEGCTATLSNWVALKPGVLRLVQVAPPSAERKMPPSLPSYVMSGLAGAMAMAWESACNEFWLAAKVVPPLVDFPKLLLPHEPTPLPDWPPMKMLPALVGSTATGMS